MSYQRPRLHIFGLPHTVTSPEYSHCAFTGKVLRFPRMMQSVGYEVYHYGVGSENYSGATKHIEVFSVEAQQEMAGQTYDSHGKKMVGDLANVAHPLYVTFNRILRDEGLLKKHLASERDILCMPFGHGHQYGVAGLPNTTVETGIGYPTLVPNSKIRIYESYAWLHWHLGKSQRGVCDYEFIIPNYFDPAEWEARPVPKDGYWLYFGRIDPIKGLDIVSRIARHRPDQKFVICGQGEYEKYLAPNVEYHPPVHGKERLDLYAGAKAVIMPTRYVEPFGGVTIEAQLCGRPVLGSVAGSFVETIKYGFNGFRCRVLGDYLAAMERIEDGGLCSPEGISEDAVEMYSMYNLAHHYDRVFELTDGLWDKGKDWFRLDSDIGPVSRAVQLQ